MLSNLSLKDVITTINEFNFKPEIISVKVLEFINGHDIIIYVYDKEGSYKYFTYDENVVWYYEAMKTANSLVSELSEKFEDVHVELIDAC